MPMAPWLLGAAMLVGPTVRPADPPPSLTIADLSFSADAQRGSSSSQSNRNQPHGLGFGGMLGAGPIGSGLGIRWFAGYVGLDTRFLLSRAVSANGISGGGFSFEVAPSVIVMLTRPNPDRAVEFRPYAGAGVNYVRAGTNAVTTGSPVTGSGTQAFAGLEAQIREANSLAIGIEVIYNKRAPALENAGVSSGTTGLVTFMFYVH